MRTELLPADIDTSLKELIEAIKGCFHENLVNVTLFGSGAEGALRQNSDLNLLVVLKTFDLTQAQKVRGAVEMLSVLRKTSIMFLRQDEIPDAARLFAVKFNDIALRHRTLYGEDIAGTLQVSRESKKILLQQTLMNYVLRTRSICATALTRSRLHQALSQSAGVLRAAAATLLELENHPPESPRAALRTVAAELGSSHLEAINAMSRARDGEVLDESITETALAGLITLAEALSQRAKQVS